MNNGEISNQVLNLENDWSVDMQRPENFRGREISPNGRMPHVRDTAELTSHELGLHTVLTLCGTSGTQSQRR